MAVDTEYFLHRSYFEAVQSIAATDTRAAAAHEELCLRYARAAIDGLVTQSPSAIPLPADPPTPAD